MNPADVYATPALVVLLVGLAAAVLWERWPRLWWRARRTVESWRVRRAAWLLELDEQRKDTT